MGKRARLHRKAVIEEREPPFRASPNKPKKVSPAKRRRVELIRRINKRLRGDTK